jgi:hypothetical protein
LTTRPDLVTYGGGIKTTVEELDETSSVGAEGGIRAGGTERKGKSGKGEGASGREEADIKGVTGVNEVGVTGNIGKTDGRGKVEETEGTERSHAAASESGRRNSGNRGIGSAGRAS